jgi:uroporphyrinogen-III decarboxylase
MNPRQILEGLLLGISPPRPLFLPIVFSHGAKLENVPLGTFLKNPTKISNSLVQIRNHLRSDGHACYFDPYLEVEALGGSLEWMVDEGRPNLLWSQQPGKGELPEGLCSPEDAVKRGRVGIALEVIRRLKSLLRDGSLLTAGVTGPFTLAARITQLEKEPSLRCEQIPEAALDIAAALVTRISAAFADAGANLIMIQEEVLPPLTAGSCETWASRLSPALNIISFYQALPVLHLTNKTSFAENCEVIFQQRWNSLVCPALDYTSSIRIPDNLMLGIALPIEMLSPQQTGDEAFERSLDYAISILRPSILTTAMDVPAGADMKRLRRVSERVLKVG